VKPNQIERPLFPGKNLWNQRNLPESGGSRTKMNRPAAKAAGLNRACPVPQIGHDE
jgi:hypothetical protein